MPHPLDLIVAAQPTAVPVAPPASAQPIDPPTLANQPNDSEGPQACQACGSPVYWIDANDRSHCELCEPPPIPGLVRQRVIAVWGEGTGLPGAFEIFEPKILK